MGKFGQRGGGKKEGLNFEKKIKKNREDAKN